MLLARHLWCNIVQNPNKSVEEFALWARGTSDNYRPGPDARLAHCIIYFQDWLRWVEEMGLSEFPHPFRFIDKAVATDTEHMGETVAADAINEEEVRTFMSQVPSRVPSINPLDRVTSFPCMMPGTSIPPLFNLFNCRYPHGIEMALTGLENVNMMGLSSYTLEHTMNSGCDISKYPRYK